MPQTGRVAGGVGDTARPTGPGQPVEDNSHAGQGSVMLDIGGEIGALVLHATAELEGVEIEIRPTGDTPFADGHLPDHPHDHDDHPHDHDDHHNHGHDHGDSATGQLDGHRLIHVAVLKRPSTSGDRYAAVYPELHAGTYELYRRPAEPVALTVSITGARVTEARWPDGY